MNDQKVRAMGFPGFVEVFKGDDSFLVADRNHNRKLDASDPQVSLLGTSLGDKLMGRPLEDRTQIAGSPLKASLTENAYQPTPEPQRYPEPKMVGIDSTRLQANTEVNNFGPRDSRTGAINLDNWFSAPSGSVIEGTTGPQVLRFGPPQWGQAESGCETKIFLPASLPLNEQIEGHLLSGRTNRKTDFVHGEVALENGQKVFHGTTDKQMADGKTYSYQITIPLFPQNR